MIKAEGAFLYLLSEFDITFIVNVKLDIKSFWTHVDYETVDYESGNMRPFVIERYFLTDIFPNICYFAF